jgi:hypothetical protein
VIEEGETGMLHGYTAWKGGIEKQHGPAGCTCRMDMSMNMQRGEMDLDLRHGAWACPMDMQNGHAEWTCRIDIQNEHAELTCSMDMHNGHA